jgi:hypothetical protein
VRANVAEEVLALKQQPEKRHLRRKSQHCVPAFGARFDRRLSIRGSPSCCRKGTAVIRNREAAGHASAGLRWLEDIWIRRRRPSLQKAHVRRNAISHLTIVLWAPT